MMLHELKWEPYINNLQDYNAVELPGPHVAYYEKKNKCYHIFANVRVGCHAQATRAWLRLDPIEAQCILYYLESNNKCPSLPASPTPSPQSLETTSRR